MKTLNIREFKLKHKIIIVVKMIKLSELRLKDRAERNNLKSSFLFPPKKEGRRKGEWIAQIVILSHAFLLNQIKSYLDYNLKNEVSNINVKVVSKTL